MVKTLLLCCALFISSPALACGVMDKAEPKVGSTVPSADHVTLHFTQAVVVGSSEVKITDRNGNAVKAGTPVSSNGGSVLSLNIAPPLGAGKYKVSWNVLWLDCNSRTGGDYKFTVAHP